MFFYTIVKIQSFTKNGLVVMAKIINVENELIIGLIGSVGVNFDLVSTTLSSNLKKTGYQTKELRISEIFNKSKNFQQIKNEIAKHKEIPYEFKNMYLKMQYGTKHRQEKGNDCWAKEIIKDIHHKRKEFINSNKKTAPIKIAYIIRSLKTKEEVALLEDVYGRNFISISIFSDEKSSVNFLKTKLNTKRSTNKKYSAIKKNSSSIMQEIKSSLNRINTKVFDQKALQKIEENDEYLENISNKNLYDSLSRFLINKDKHEYCNFLKAHGQDLAQCYPMANFFIYQDKNINKQVARFVKLLFGYPLAEPTIDEYFMFCAQATAYRSLDLDRQVGAVIVNQDNELIAAGFNDVSKVGGGHFEPHDDPNPRNLKIQKNDYRDYTKNSDYNDKKLDEISQVVYSKLQKHIERTYKNQRGSLPRYNMESLPRSKNNSKFLQQSIENLVREELKNITEYKRSTHAEMSALLDAARRGVPVRGCTMYINTYPCHTCAKHIIASGIKKVVYLYPYQKSHAINMFRDMLEHGIDTGNAKDKIFFEPFLGVSYNRYMYIFKNDGSKRQEMSILKTGKKYNGSIKWKISKKLLPKDLQNRMPHSYITREIEAINQTSKKASVTINNEQYITKDHQ